MDYICRYENLQEDLKHVESQIDVKFTHLMQKKANASFRPKRDYRSMYSKEMKKKVENFYRKEIEYFGYEF